MTDKCPVCGSEAEKIYKLSSREYYTKCIRCGVFKLLQEEYLIVEQLELSGKMALSHWIRKQNIAGHKPNFSESIYDKLFFMNLKLPNPAEQADNLIKFLGDEASGDFGKEVQIDSLSLLGIMGTASPESAEMVIIELIESELIKVEKYYVISSEII